MRYEVKVTTTQTFTIEAATEHDAAFTALDRAEGYTQLQTAEAMLRPGARVLDVGKTRHAVNGGDVQPLGDS